MAAHRQQMAEAAATSAAEQAAAAVKRGVCGGGEEAGACTETVEAGVLNPADPWSQPLCLATKFKAHMLSGSCLTRDGLEHLFSRPPYPLGQKHDVLLATLPLALFASAAQLLTASFARSFREAQTYLSLMVFVPTLPAALVTVMPIESQLWMMTVPVFGQQVLLMDVIRGDPIVTGWVVVAAAVSTVGALICLHLTASLFRRETIVYGR